MLSTCANLFKTLDQILSVDLSVHGDAVFGVALAHFLFCVSHYKSRNLEQATRNKCHASSNKCLTSSNKKLLGTSATLVVTSALLVVTRSY